MPQFQLPRSIAQRHDYFKIAVLTAEIALNYAAGTIDIRCNTLTALPGCRSVTVVAPEMPQVDLTPLDYRDNDFKILVVFTEIALDDTAARSNIRSNPLSLLPRETRVRIVM